MSEPRAVRAGSPILFPGGPSSWGGVWRLAALALAAVSFGCGEGGASDGGGGTASGGGDLVADGMSREAAGPPAEVVLEASPLDGQGAVRLTPDDPVVCESWGTWAIEWTAGPDGLAAGGALVLQVSPFWGWSPPQTTHAGRPGWTTISTSDPAAELSLGNGAVPMTVVASVASGGVGPGETVTFVYGDDSAGEGGRARADRFAEARQEFVIKTDGDGDGFFAAPPDPPALRILPGPPVFLAVAGPATAFPGDTIRVGVHGLDRRENRAPLPAGRLELVLRALRDEGGEDPPPDRSMLAAEIADGANGYGAALGPCPPGLWRLQARLIPHDATVAPLTGAHDLLWVDGDRRFADILWGDIHMHSALSDGTGEPADLYAYARDVAGLDVACVTDHDAHGLEPLAGSSWETVRAATRKAHVPGRFVTLLGYEWTSWTWGHRNVYFPGDDGEVYAFPDEASDTPGELWARLTPWGAMTIPHHPGGGPVPIDWSVPSDMERERVVEICSIHGSSEAAGVERGIYRPVPGASVRDALNAGHRLGFLASGDTHDGHPGRRTPGAPANGLVAFRTEARTRDAVWEAIDARRVYGTSGPRILVASDWGGTAPGREGFAAPNAPIRVGVVAPEPIEVVELVGPEGAFDRAYGGGRRVDLSFSTVSPEEPPAWIYVRVVLATGEVAWDSPWWPRAAAETVP